MNLTIPAPAEALKRLPLNTQRRSARPLDEFFACGLRNAAWAFSRPELAQALAMTEFSENLVADIITAWFAR